MMRFNIKESGYKKNGKREVEVWEEMTKFSRKKVMNWNGIKTDENSKRSDKT